MATMETTEPLNSEQQERRADDDETDDLEMENIPGMFKITGKKKKIIIGIFLVVIILSLILNITMFIVGITSTKKCPIQPNIPIYLIVAGILGIANKALTSIYYCKDDIQLLKYMFQVLFAIEIIWGIIGSYWIYSIYKPNFSDIPKTPYCNKTVYMFAFWLLTSNYIFGIFLMFVTCCIMCGFLYTAMTSTNKA